MKHRNTYRTAFSALLIAAAMLSVWGCTKEDLTECLNPVLNIKAYAVVDGGEEEVDDTVISDVSLYVFDEQERFLEYIPCGIRETIALDFPQHKRLHIVSWGNSRCGNLYFPQLKVGTPMSEGFVGLFPADGASSQSAAGLFSSRVGGDCYTSPDDLFYGKTTLDVEGMTTTSQSILLSIRRKVASCNVTMVGLQDKFKLTDEELAEVSVNVRETHSTIDFYGRFGGAGAGYRPVGGLNDKGHHITPTFNLFPSVPGEFMTIEIYCADTLLATIAADDSGTKLTAQEGKLLNVLVVFSNQLSVEIKTTPWGEEYVWKIWN